MSKDKPVIVVGYDGSPASRTALEYAARIAGAGGCLYIVHAYRVPRDYWGSQYYSVMLDEAAAEARGLIERLPGEFDVLRDVDWYSEVVGSVPAHAIAEVALTRHADQIVVGSRGHGRARALLGSVSHELIHLAACPVTVIPERAIEAEPTELEALTGTA